MAVVSLIVSFIAAVASIAMSNIDFQEARVAFDRMYEFAASEPEYEPSISKNEPSALKAELDQLEIKNLNFRFPGRGLLLKDLNMTISKGQIVTFFGEIGCGKSTLLSILQRFYPIESGEILINGEDWMKSDNFQWRNKIAIVSQHVKLFNGTILENIGLADISNEKEVVAFCKEIGLHVYIMGFQQGYATIVIENRTAILNGTHAELLKSDNIYRNSFEEILIPCV